MIDQWLNVLKKCITEQLSSKREKKRTKSIEIWVFFWISSTYIYEKYEMEISIETAHKII